MFTFCDVLRKTKQEHKQTLVSAQYGLEIISSKKPPSFTVLAITTVSTQNWER